jgi:hypothetical protein
MIVFFFIWIFGICVLKNVHDIFEKKDSKKYGWRI